MNPQSGNNEEVRRNDSSTDVRRERITEVRQLTEETALRLLRSLETSRPVRHLRSSQIATAIVGTIGLALFIVGVEKVAEDIPVVSNPYGSVIVGLILLAATGLLLRRLLD
jgi:hypothetical protein